ncbi:MAG: thioredoxin family protein [Pseudomonadales bacterium]|nr:thioredoxin family protein [Pseudomonadales bacterium]
MALTPSTMLPLGTLAPDFTLPDTVSGERINLHQAKGDKGTLVFFICNHCPYVVHLQHALALLGRDYLDSGIEMIAISANDVKTHPQDGPEQMREFAAQNHFNFPYLYDESQAVARAYDAACTPDFFLFDGDLKCVYRGQFDDSRPGNGKPVTGTDLRAAMDCVLAGQPVPEDQVPSMGCNIKWKA